MLISSLSEQNEESNEYVFTATYNVKKTVIGVVILIALSYLIL